MTDMVRVASLTHSSSRDIKYPIPLRPSRR